MARAVKRQLGEPIDYARSWTIGDKPSDVECGESLGTRTVLLTSRHWTRDDLSCQPTLFAASLRAAVPRLSEIVSQGTSR